jgi:hypothetical protein
MRVLFFFLLFVSISSIAQNTGIIAGYVKDSKTQEALSGVLIGIVGTTYGTVTNDEGYYKLINIPARSYNLIATLLGYTRQEKFDVIVSSGNTNIINFELEPVSLELKEVNINTPSFVKPIETPNSLKNLSTQEIKSYPGGNNDIAKVVQSLPGVSGSVGFRNDVIIRGGGPSENVYYLDAMEIPNINHFATQGSAGGPVGLLNVSFIEDVSLASSGFASKYDNVLSGVLQFKQRTGNPEKTQYNFRLGASEFAGTVEGPIAKNKNLTYIVSVRRSYLQFLFKLIDLPFLPDYYDWQYKVNYKINARNEFSFLGLGSLDLFKLNPPKKATLEQLAILDQISKYTQYTATVGLSWKHLLKNGAMNLTWSANYLKNGITKYDDNDESIESKLRLRIRSTEFEQKLRWEMNKYFGKWKWNYNAGIQDAKYTNDNYNKLTINLGNRILQQVIQFNTNLIFYKMGAGAQVSRKFIHDKLSTSIGLRTDMNTFTMDGMNPLKTLSPRASISYAINAHWSVNASAGRFYKLPQYTILGFQDSVIDNGVKKLDYINKNSTYIPCDHLVAGVEYAISPSSRITVEGFYKIYNNYPVSNRDSVSLANLGGDFGILGNEAVSSVGKGHTYGVEFFFQQRFTKNFYAVVAYTYYYSQFTGFDTKKYIPSTWDNRNLISFTGGYKFKRNWELGARFRFIGRQPYTPYDTAASRINYSYKGTGTLDKTQYNQLRLDNVYNVLDIRVDKKWNFKKWALDAFIDLQNIYQSLQPGVDTYTLKRNPDNSFATNNGKPFDGTNGIGLLISYPNAASFPTIGIVVEF